MSAKITIKKTVGDRVRCLNEEGVLAEPIRIGAVAGALSALGEAQALEVLDRLHERGTAVEDPNAWVNKAAKAVAQGAFSAEAFYEAEGGDAGEEEGEEEEDESVELEQSVVGRVAELDLDIGEIARELSLVDSTTALDVLKDVDVSRGNASQLSAWIVKELARRKHAVSKVAGKGKSIGTVLTKYWQKGNKVAGKGKSIVGNAVIKGAGKGKSIGGSAVIKGAGKGKSIGGSAVIKGAGKGKSICGDLTLTASQLKLKKRLRYMSTNGLLAEVQYNSVVKAALDSVDEKSGMHILDNLWEKYDQIENPMGYIVVACQKSSAKYEEIQKERREEKWSAKGKGKGNKDKGKKGAEVDEEEVEPPTKRAKKSKSSMDREVGDEEAWDDW